MVTMGTYAGPLHSRYPNPPAIRPSPTRGVAPRGHRAVASGAGGRGGAGNRQQGNDAVETSPESGGGVGVPPRFAGPIHQTAIGTTGPGALSHRGGGGSAAPRPRRNRYGLGWPHVDGAARTVPHAGVLHRGRVADGGPPRRIDEPPMGRRGYEGSHAHVSAHQERHGPHGAPHGHAPGAPRLIAPRAR